VGVVVGCQAGAEPQNSVAKLVVSPFVLEFLSGCLVAWLAGRGVRAGWRVAVGLGLGYAVVGVVVATAAAPVPGTFDMTSPRVRVLVFGPPSALLVYGLVSAEGRWPRKLPKWLLRVGDASYSLYLWHLTVILAGGIVGMWLPHTRAAHTLWLLGIFGAALGVGLLVYELVERPLLNLAKRRKPVPVPAPAVPDPLPVPTRRAA
jgi:peptidoglycan/LPS O-acetylase OafA/YrhL